MGAMALAVCLLFDPRAESAVRKLWARLESAGIGTLATHTHGHHVPHLTYASLLEYDLRAVRESLVELPAQPPLTLHLDALGTFRRSRCWLAPAVTPELVTRQATVVEAVLATGADLHHHYATGRWLPHVSLAPRLHLDDLATVAAAVYDVLPITAQVTRAALIDTSTGNRVVLPQLV
jgi:2'-5' RNA ligase